MAIPDDEAFIIGHGGFASSSDWPSRMTTLCPLIRMTILDGELCLIIRMEIPDAENFARQRAGG